MDRQLAARMGEVEEMYEETLVQMSDPALVGDQSKYREVTRRHSELKGLVDAFHEYRSAAEDAEDAAELAKTEDDDGVAAELKAMAEERSIAAERLEKRLRVMLVPKDPNDDKDVIVEIRGAVGGDEAAIWAGDLFRMYEKYAEAHGWTIEPMNTSESEAGGFKEMTFAVKGKGAFSRFKFEAGPHRVQRVPKTEAQGRVHTSIATVAVLPEVEDVEIHIPDYDVQVDVFRSTGPGGQSVNTTDSAVRLTHKPTGLVVTCQDEKSQLQNKVKAMRVLRARLYQIEMDRQHAAVAADRKAQVGSGERAEKIRTYNYKDNRVTDHRIGLTIKRLPDILAGDLDDIVDALTLDDEARRLAGG
ncbi:MAG TPA: peptide chain release factor 1 [Acidimicrobiia bacterium]|nr:peptide chain release factor 1 [Acidimicrobiia bacterium]